MGMLVINATTNTLKGYRSGDFYHISHLTYLFVLCQNQMDIS